MSEHEVTGQRHKQTAREKRAASVVKERLLGNDDHETDDDPKTAAADDGVWVQTWVWVPDSQDEEDT